MPNHSKTEKKPREWALILLPLLRPFRRPLCWAGFAMVLDALLTSLRPWPLKVVIDCVLSNRRTRVPLIGGWLANAADDRMLILNAACAATLLIALCTGLLTYYYTHAMGGIGQRFVFTLRCRLFAHMQRLSLRFHDSQRTGDLLTRLTSDINAIQDVVSSGLIILDRKSVG